MLMIFSKNQIPKKMKGKTFKKLDASCEPTTLPTFIKSECL